MPSKRKEGECPMIRNIEMFKKDYLKTKSFYNNLVTGINRKNFSENDMLKFDRYIRVLESQLTEKLIDKNSIQKFQYLEKIFGELLEKTN